MGEVPGVGHDACGCAVKPNNLYDPYWQPQVTVPVKRVNDRWEFFYGGDVPVKDGAIGELRIMTAAITDEAFRSMVTTETLIKVLEKGTTLYAALSDRSQNSAPIDRKNWPKVLPQDVPLGTTRFARVSITSVQPQSRIARAVAQPDGADQGGLWLRVRGLEKSELHCSGVQLPDEMAQDEATSLNHAFTMLSKHYERHRISNTGNVYTRFFYPEVNGNWYPLEDIRSGVLARVERDVIRNAWVKIEADMGWCRLPEKTKARQGGGRRGPAPGSVSNEK